MSRSPQSMICGAAQARNRRHSSSLRRRPCSFTRFSTSDGTFYRRSRRFEMSRSRIGRRPPSVRPVKSPRRRNLRSPSHPCQPGMWPNPCTLGLGERRHVHDAGTRDRGKALRAAKPACAVDPYGGDQWQDFSRKVTSCNWLPNGCSTSQRISASWASAVKRSRSRMGGATNLRMGMVRPFARAPEGCHAGSG